MSNVVERITQTNEKVNSVWQQYDKRFENVDEQLDKVFSKFSEGIQSLSSKSSKHSEQLTNQLNAIIGSVRDLLEGISETLEDYHK